MLRTITRAAVVYAEAGMDARMGALPGAGSALFWGGEGGDSVVGG
jgi:hypothetical protein